MTVIRESRKPLNTPRGHTCRTPGKYDDGVGKGAIWQCDTCGQIWKCKRIQGYSRDPVWRKLRLYKIAGKKEVTPDADE